MPFIIPTKRIKYLGIFNQEGSKKDEDLYMKNSKTLLKDWKRYKWKEIMCSLTGWINSIKFKLKKKTTWKKIK